MAESGEPQANNPLSRKLNKILETRLDNDKEMVEALKALSTFFVDNSLRSRRNLRGDIEKRSLAINESFESAFREVKQQLDDVHADIEQMSKCCTEMTSRLKSARDQTSDLISKTTKLQSESQRIQMKEVVAGEFISRFQLTPEETQALKGTKNGPITEDFFQALGRVREIHNDCKVLLRTKQQTAGLQIMETMALHLESSYEKLYRWTQDECRSLTGDLPDISSLVSRAMAALQDRPVLFNNTLTVSLSSLHGMDAQSVKDAMAKFDKFLASPDSLIMPQCNLLRTTRLRDTVHKRSVDAVCATYKTLYEAILDERNKYQDVKTLVPRSPDQVTSLLT
ncbi:PREDICTED: conserved oligomeric Golgi complex subunit 6-like [Acropora digitifera]|uniref:conserved oligomeric Golgi complex subunit 6-like n=1 Tax=Acropora digitifera TaxID=70779 RepID=UPI00077A4560|nr:PREDICTED: conserved oligomeric Golgi complex subunit 6-like [Acropora digitifera]